MTTNESINTTRSEDHDDAYCDPAALLAAAGNRYRFPEDNVIRTAWDRNLRRSVGVQQADDQDRGLLNRSRLAAKLEHPNILPIHDLTANAGNDVVCVTRHMRGEALAEWIRRGPVAIESLNQLLFRLEAVCDALAYAHDQGIAHSAIDTSAILLGDFGEVIVTGWLDGKHREDCTDAQWRASVQEDISALADVLQAIIGATTVSPESLLAVCARARGNNPYSTATELGEELRRYRNGYPTLAEAAGFARSLLMFIGRHRRIATAASLALVGVAVVCLGYGRLLANQTTALRDAYRKLAGATEEENAARKDAEASLNVLRDQAPVFADLAQHCLRRAEFKRAKHLVDQSLILDPTLVAGHRVLGNWHQTMGNYALAIKAYVRAIELNPNDEASLQGIDVCRRFVGSNGKPTEEDYRQLAKYMVKYKRYSEACRLVNRFEPGLDLLKDACGGLLADNYVGLLVDGPSPGKQPLGVSTIVGRAAVNEGLEVVGKSEVAKYVRRVDLRSAQNLYSIESLASMSCEDVDVCFTDVIDLSPLADKRLESIGVAYTATSNLWPLAGHPLVHVDAAGCGRVNDLEPLRGAPLISLGTNSASVDDLEPLADAGFRRFVNHCGLCVRDCPVFDLRPLRGMVMKDLFLDGTDIEDLGPLQDVEMTELWVSKTKIRDLTPIANQKKLRKLILTNCTSLTDLTPLKGVNSLRFIRLENTGVTDLTPLADLKLTAIGISPGKITKGMDVLRNMKSLKRICTTPQRWGMMYQRTPWIPVKKFWADYDKNRPSAP